MDNCQRLTRIGEGDSVDAAMMKLILTLVCLVSFSTPCSWALILWGLDNNANQFDPGTGAGWGAVAKVTNSDGLLVSGSAVYLGNGFLLTANHVDINLTYSFITFDQVETFAIDPEFNDGVRPYGKQVSEGVDLAVFRLSAIPSGREGIDILTTPVESFGAANEATLVGWGLGRDAVSPIGGDVVEWGDGETSSKRWGLNAPRTVSSVGYAVGARDYLYEAIITYAGNTNSPNPSNKGLGENEAGATLYDSGSGLFQEIGDEWYLIGLTAGVQTFGSTTFGLDSGGGGDANFFVRVSTYEQEVSALVPEPSTISLVGLAGLIITGTVVAGGLGSGDGEVYSDWRGIRAVMGGN